MSSFKGKRVAPKVHAKARFQQTYGEEDDNRALSETACAFCGETAPYVVVVVSDRKQARCSGAVCERHHGLDFVRELGAQMSAYLERRYPTAEA